MDLFPAPVAVIQARTKASISSRFMTNFYHGKRRETLLDPEKPFPIITWRTRRQISKCPFLAARWNFCLSMQLFQVVFSTFWLSIEQLYI